MNRDEIIRMAREAGFNVGTAPQIERFAQLVAAEERTACADICAQEAIRLFCGKARVSQLKRHTAELLRIIEKRIQARGQM